MFDLNEVPGQTRAATEYGGNVSVASEEGSGDGVLEPVAEEVAIKNGKLSVGVENLSTGTEIIESVSSEAAKSGNDVDGGGKYAGDRQSTFTKRPRLLAFESLQSKRQSDAGSSHSKDAGLETKSLLARPSLLLPPTPAQKQEAAILASVSSPTPRSEEAAVNTHLLLSPASSDPLKKRESSLVAELLPFSKQKQRNLEALPEAHTFSYEETDYLRRLDRGQSANGLSVVDQESEDRSISFSPSKKTASGPPNNLLMDINRSSTDGASMLTTLALRSSSHYLKSCKSRNDSSELALFSKVTDAEPCLKQATDLCPCWQGRLRTDGPFLTPISAYCLGELKPASRLRKLPTILRLRKHVKLEELEKDLQHGLTEPVLRFMPSTEASIEEVELFNSLVKELSGGSGVIEAPHMLNLELSQKGQIRRRTTPPCAALISWDEDGEYSLDAKLYLISSHSFRMIQLRQLETTSCSLEKLTELDLVSLYGFFCRSSSISSMNGAPGMLQSGQQDLQRPNLEMGSNKHPPTFSPYESSTYSETSPFMSKVSTRFERKERENQGAANNKQVDDTITDNYCIKSSTNEPDINKEKVGRKLLKENKFEERETESFDYEKTVQKQGLSSGTSDRWSEKVSHLRQMQGQDTHQNFSCDIECDKNLEGSVREQMWEEGLEQCKGEEFSKEKFLQVLQPDHVMGKRMAGSDAGLPFSHKVSSDHGIDVVQIRKRDRENVEESFTLIKKFKDLRQLNEQASEHGHQADEEVRISESLFMPQVELGKLQDFFPCTNLKASEKPMICEDGLELDQGMGKCPDLSSASVEAIPYTSKGPNREAVLPLEVEPSTEVEATFVPLSLRSGEKRGVEDMGPSHWDNTLAGSPHTSVQNKEISLEFHLDGNDKETQTWLSSKQTSLYLQEEYGVNATIKSELSAPYLNSKTESQPGPLLVKISMPVLDSCDATEAKWFVDQAAYMIKAIASRGVFIKCLWYKGPVQLQPGYGPLSIPVVVKKIKGDDGKNLERMQDITGVMIGVVLRKGVVAAPHEPKPQPRLIGLRLKCVRRKGLVEASKQAEALLACVADHFSKELANLADLHEARLQQIDSVSNQNSPSMHVATKNLLPDLSVKGEDVVNSPPGSLKLVEKSAFAVTRETDTYFTSKTAPMKGDTENDIHMEPKKVSSRPLYVSNLPDNITPIKIRHIFENVITDKLGIVAGGESGSDLVVDVRYIQDKFCAFVELASDDLLNACLRLFKEDTSVFQGLSVELGLAANTKTERQSSFSRIGPRNGLAELARSTSMARHKVEDYGRRQYGALSNESDSDYGHDLWLGDNDGGRGDHPVDKPRPLFLSELMRNASGPTIKKLFEDIIIEYIGPSLVCSSGRQLVLDVRYVPSRGCAFVDLATPELVEFMLDLHSRRPEVFMNMKMELGRRPVPYSIEAEKRSNMNARDGLHGKSLKYGYGYRSSGSHKKTEKRPHGGQSPLEYNEDSKSDDYFRQGSRPKKQRSDPEKTVYADRLPGNASEGMIRRIFERVLVQHMTRKELDAVGDTMITEVRHIPPKYCAFVVFATEELTRLALHLYNQDEEIFECMRLKPHFHSRLEDLYSDDVPEQDSCRPPLFKDKGSDLETNDHVRYRQSDSYDARSRLAAHRAVTATAFIEVDRRKSVYVDKIPDGLSEFSMREMFEKVFQHRRPGCDGHIVSQVAYFRDKFDPSKLCAFVELKTEEATQDLVDFYYANQDAFEGMRIRPGLKYSN